MEKSIENKNIPNKNENIIDKNYILIGSYKGFNYYLDRYSVKIKKNKTDKQIWSQFIFPIGSNVTAENSRSTLQKFYYNGKKCYNSTRASNNINDIEDKETKKFLWKCFRIGYYYAFNKYPNIDVLNEQFNDKDDNTTE